MELTDCDGLLFSTAPMTGTDVPSVCFDLFGAIDMNGTGKGQVKDGY
jgi:hypothetical protein